MDFGIMFFSSARQAHERDLYYLVKEAAHFADQHNFCCIWTPERHFHEFGGPFPNPSVLSAALAMITSRLQIRAGSVISPLHHPVRIAEEWSVADNLSGGRVAISFGSGWNIDDFVLAPATYEKRQKIMYEQIATIQELWRGRSVPYLSPTGREIPIKLYPQPVQPELPIWITSSGNVETFASAGAMGANLLTHLLGQDMATLGEKIRVYRQAREKNHHNPETGIVSLMLHTFIGNDIEQIRSEVRAPLREYLRSAVSLEREAARGGGVISGGKNIKAEEIMQDDMEEMLDLAFERYFQTASLMGTPSSCLSMVSKCETIGVNEIACLIDFYAAPERVLESLKHLDVLAGMCSSRAVPGCEEDSITEFISDF